MALINNSKQDEETSILDSVNITSNLRAPGEFKYTYFGENSSDSDDSYFHFIPTWSTTSPIHNQTLLTSTYNTENTAMVFLNQKDSCYNIILFKNNLDCPNDNYSLTHIGQIDLEIPKPPESGNHHIPSSSINDQPLIKLFLAADDFLLFNEVDKRILLFEMSTGKYMTLFEKKDANKRIGNDDENTKEGSRSGNEGGISKEYNIIETYDEYYKKYTKNHKSTYVFLYCRDKEQKRFNYYYFILNSVDFKTINTISLTPLVFDNAFNAEPYSIKVLKLNEVKNKVYTDKWYYLFIFLIKGFLFYFVSSEGHLSLNNILFNYALYTKTSSKFTIEKSTIKITESTQSSRKNSCHIHHCINKLSYVLYFFEYSEQILAFPFYDNASSSSLFQSLKRDSNIVNDTNKKSPTGNVGGKICNVDTDEYYLFTLNKLQPFECRSVNVTLQNIVFAIQDKIYIYARNCPTSRYHFCFYEEQLSQLLSFKMSPYCYLLTGNKLMKIVYNSFTDKYFNENITYGVKTNTSSDNTYPMFELEPEKLFLNYRMILQGKNPVPKVVVVKKENGEGEGDSEGEKETVPKEPEKDEAALKEEKKKCEICGLKSLEEPCSECKTTSCCCDEHYKEYFCHYHFFDCHLSKFFNQEDIITEPILELRYMKLYNGLIRTFGQLLNHIFKRISCSNDYQFYLKYIIIMLNIMDKFSFPQNLEDFILFFGSKTETTTTSLGKSTESIEDKTVRSLFYLEAIFFYVQMNFLKCTFAMKSRLYNLTDCYLKIIKSDLVPLLLKKKQTKPLCVNLKYSTIAPLSPAEVVKQYAMQMKSKFNPEMYSKASTGVTTTGEEAVSRYNTFDFFFDLNRIFNNNTEIDLTELYLVKYLFCQSLLVKYKLKINSSIDIKESFRNIASAFEVHFTESQRVRNTVVPYCYFSLSFYLVETGKVQPTIYLLKGMVANFSEKADIKLQALTYYNLGILQYASSQFRTGIHHLETSYRLIDEGKLSTIFLLYVLDSLSLAYLNQKSLFKAYIMVKTSLNERNKIKNMENKLHCIKLNVYLNYIIDLYEYSYVRKTRELWKQHEGDHDLQWAKENLIKTILGNNERELVTSEQNLEHFVNTIRFIFSLKNDLLSSLNSTNVTKIVPSKEETQQEKAMINNPDTSMTSTSFIGNKEGNGLEPELVINDFEEDIEFKTSFYDLLSRSEQVKITNLKQFMLKREIILRDPLGLINPFNINYHPIYSEELINIIRMLKSNFLIKEIFYCCQNERWRDEYYDFEPDFCLYGLAKYLKLEKIKNMIWTEKSKQIEKMNTRKVSKVVHNSFICNNSKEKDKNTFESIGDSDEDNEQKQEDEIDYDRLAAFKAPMSKVDTFPFKIFKEKYKEIQRDNKDLGEYLRLTDEDLQNLFKKFNGSQENLDVLLEKPLFLLNYIYTAVPDKNPADVFFKRRENRLRSKSCISIDRSVIKRERHERIENQKEIENITSVPSHNSEQDSLIIETSVSLELWRGDRFTLISQREAMMLNIKTISSNLNLGKNEQWKKSPSITSLRSISHMNSTDRKRKNSTTLLPAKFAGRNLLKTMSREEKLDKNDVSIIELKEQMNPEQYRYRRSRASFNTQQCFHRIEEKLNKENNEDINEVNENTIENLRLFDLSGDRSPQSVIKIPDYHPNDNKGMNPSHSMYSMLPNLNKNNNTNNNKSQPMAMVPINNTRLIKHDRNKSKGKRMERSCDESSTNPTTCYVNESKKDLLVRNLLYNNSNHNSSYNYYHQEIISSSNNPQLKKNKSSNSMASSIMKDNDYMEHSGKKFYGLGKKGSSSCFSVLSEKTKPSNKTSMAQFQVQPEDNDREYIDNDENNNEVYYRFRNNNEEEEYYNERSVINEEEDDEKGSVREKYSKGVSMRSEEEKYKVVYVDNSSNKDYYRKNKGFEYNEEYYEEDGKMYQKVRQVLNGELVEVVNGLLENEERVQKLTHNQYPSYHQSRDPSIEPSIYQYDNINSQASQSQSGHHPKNKRKTNYNINNNIPKLNTKFSQYQQGSNAPNTNNSNNNDNAEYTNANLVSNSETHQKYINSTMGYNDAFDYENHARALERYKRVAERKNGTVKDKGNGYSNNEYNDGNNSRKQTHHSFQRQTKESREQEYEGEFNDDFFDYDNDYENEDHRMRIEEEMQSIQNYSMNNTLNYTNSNMNKGRNRAGFRKK